MQILSVFLIDMNRLHAVVVLITLVLIALFDGRTVAGQQQEPRRNGNAQVNSSSLGDCSPFNISSTLLTRLFTNYLDSVPESSNKSSPLQVNIAVQVLRLLNVDEMRQVLSFSAKVTLEWEDNRLTWVPQQYGKMKRIEVPNSVAVWVPDVTWIERLEADFLWRSQGRVSLNYRGELSLSSQVVININCYMDPGYFPFDSHRCSLTFEPLVHTKTEVELATRLTEGIHNLSLIHDQWYFSVHQPECTVRSHSYPVGSYQSEEFVTNQCAFYATRRPLYHLFNLFLPAAVITFMTVFSFLIPPTESDMKIQFSLSIMLQLVVFLMYIYDSLPISATRIPLLSWFFALCLIMVAVSCVATVIISYTHWLGEDNIVVPSWVRQLFIDKIAPVIIPVHLTALHKLRAETKSHRVSTVSTPSLSNSERSRVGIFRLGKFQVPLVVMEKDSESSAQADGKIDQDAAESNSVRVHFDSKNEELTVHPVDTPPLRTLKKAKTSSPSRHTANRSLTTDQEWNINKIEWSLTSIVLDRLCAILFVIMFGIVVASTLIIGYRRRPPSLG